jgi:site-specific DNA-methyltransferase (adenine-specific)
VSVYYSDDTVTLHLGEMLDVLPTLPDASVDAVVCDPPYGLANHHPRVIAEVLAAWLSGDRAYVPTDGQGGFMGRAWDRFVPPPAAWDECLRVLKPGGHLVAFAAPRTADLMGMAIRLAGFEIRDSIMWVSGSGFPKSLNVAKAIEAGGGRPEDIRRMQMGADYSPSGRGRVNYDHGAGSAMGAVAQEWAPTTPDAACWEGWGTALKPAHEPIVVARKPPAGTVAANVLEHGTGALNIDGSRVASTGESRERVGEASQARRYTEQGGTNFAALPGRRGGDPSGRWPTNVLLGHGPECVEDGPCQAGCPVAEMDRQSGVTPSNARANKGERHGSVYGGGHGPSGPAGPRGVVDSGGASRFFPVFRYEAKAPAFERPRLADGTAWPTVKPLALMRWLVRLVTPPGGLVLDWCAGTGTTLEAAAIEGFQAIGVEREQDGADLCVARLSKPIAPVLFGEVTA